MANKRRPKKTKAPYRKYVGGVGFVSQNTIVKEVNLDNNYYTDHFSEDELTSVVEKSEGESTKPSTKHGKTANQVKLRSFEGTGVFPNEIYLRIIDYVIQMDNGLCEDADNKLINTETLDSKALWVDPRYMYVCWNWYYMMISFIYKAPKLVSKNFGSFMETLDADKKRKRFSKSEPKLCELVNVLDLSMIIQSGKNSFISKLLRRCSVNLKEFIAPQTSFGYAPLISLKSCEHLQVLNLALVSETVELDQLFLAIQNFKELTHISFPRSSINCDVFLQELEQKSELQKSHLNQEDPILVQRKNSEYVWPESVQHLKLSGGLTKAFAKKCPLPKNLKTLEFAHCPLLDAESVYQILGNCSASLETLVFHYPMPGLNEHSLDNLLKYTSENLQVLQIVADYCSKWLFQDESNMSLNLEVLYLDCSGSLGQMFKIHPDDLTVAIMENRLPSLKKIYVSCKIGWDMNSDDVDDLINVLEDQGGKLYVTY